MFLFGGHIEQALGHDNEVWTDTPSGGTGMVYGQQNCGMGYFLFFNEDGSKRGMLYAGHWHELAVNFAADVGCAHFMSLIMEE
jgi:hypothetical protein